MDALRAGRVDCLVVAGIDVARDAYPDDPDWDYAIPPSNPFASAGGRLYWTQVLMISRGLSLDDVYAKL